MKKKGNRSIPDFSRKRPAAPQTLGHQQQQPSAAPVAPVAPRAPVVKPHSTSSKSGRRGS